MLDPAEFGKAMAAIVKDQTGPLLKRIEELEARHPEKGEDGNSVTVEDIAPLISEQVRAAVSALPAPKDGLDADPIDISDVVKGVLATDEIRMLVNLEAVSYLQENPPPKGDTGKSLTIEDISLFLDAALAKWALEFERRASDTLSKVIEKIPAPKDGNDGVDFSNCEMEYDGERKVTIRGNGGEITKHIDLPLDKGYWRDGMLCEKSDIVTHDGHAWISLRENKSKPCYENKEDWRLFARRGRDGRDHTDKPPPGPVKLGGSDA